MYSVSFPPQVPHLTFRDGHHNVRAVAGEQAFAFLLAGPHLCLVFAHSFGHTLLNKAKTLGIVRVRHLRYLALEALVGRPKGARHEECRTPDHEKQQEQRAPAMVTEYASQPAERSQVPPLWSSSAGGA